MQTQSYDQRRLSYSAIVSTLALLLALAALCVGGAMATGVIVTSKQIKNGTILTQDIHKNGVRSSDVKNDTIGSADIAAGAVGPQDLALPAPAQIEEPGAPPATPTKAAFSKIDDVGAYTKEDPSSILEVDWTGTVEGHNGGETSGCVFQIRVDGQPAAGGGGEVFGGGIVSVSATALFSGLNAGPHQVEIWARLAAFEQATAGDRCTVGPAAGGVGQTFVVSEQVF